MTFHVGQKVVCVDDRGTDLLVAKEIYEIEGFEHDDEITYLIIVGIATGKQDRGMFTTRFRPIVEKKTDISVFTAMLKHKQRELQTTN